MEPRDFHRGTIVHRTNTSEYGVVLFAEKDGDGWWVWYDVDDDYVVDLSSAWLEHEDGAPLGKWVPIANKWPAMTEADAGMSCSDDIWVIRVEDANALIRGESWK